MKVSKKTEKLLPKSILISQKCSKGGKGKNMSLHIFSPHIYICIYTGILHTPLWIVIPIISCIFAEAPTTYVKSCKKLLNLSNMLQICSEWCLQGPKTAPRLILGTPGGPKVHSSGHKGHPMRFKCRTRVSRGSPRAPKGIPRKPKWRPKWSETTPGVPKGDLAKIKKLNCNIT